MRDSKEDDDNKDNCLEFAADGSIDVNELQLQSIWVNKGLAKTAFAEVLDWIEQADPHQQYIC